MYIGKGPAFKINHILFGIHTRNKNCPAFIVLTKDNKLECRTLSFYVLCRWLETNPSALLIYFEQNWADFINLDDYKVIPYNKLKIGIDTGTKYPNHISADMIDSIEILKDKYKQLKIINKEKRKK